MRHCLLTFVLLHGFLLADEIPAETHMAMHVQQTLRSDTAKPGDRAHFRVAIPVTDGRRVIVPAGTYVEGVVAKAKRSGRLRGRAELEIELTRLIFEDGRVRLLTPVRMDSPSPRKPNRDNNRAAGWAVGLLGTYVVYSVEYGPRSEFVVFGAPGVALASSLILQRGGEVELRPGTEVGVYFDYAVPLD